MPLYVRRVVIKKLVFLYTVCKFGTKVCCTRPPYTFVDRTYHFFYNISMYEEFVRSAAYWGADAMQKLYSAKIALFGVGGVGGWCAEALARSGVGNIDLFDGDCVSLSNINRQAVALHSTIGRSKAEVMAARIRDVNPAANVRAFNIFIDESSISAVRFEQYDYVLDAIDTVTSKVLIAERCVKEGVREVMCMGTGNKKDITSFRVADISKTSVCPLARAVRTLLRKRGIESGIKAVFSTELPAKNLVEDGPSSRHIPASIIFAPAAAGLIMAQTAVTDIIEKN